MSMTSTTNTRARTGTAPSCAGAVVRPTCTARAPGMDDAGSFMAIVSEPVLEELRSELLAPKFLVPPVAA